MADIRNRIMPPLGALLLIQAAVGVTIASAVRSRGWDDGAITLAFSRTFSDTGRIALSAASERVEGFSSPSWFLINAAIARFNPGFSGAIFWSQIFTAACVGVTTVFVFLLAERLSLKRTTAVAIGLAFSVFGPALTEVANGMEMALLSASSTALVYFVYYKRNLLAASISSIVFINTRFEAIVYFNFIIFALFCFRDRRTFLCLWFLGCGTFLAQEAVRYVVFSDFFPATIHAKAHFPYSKSGFIGVASHLLSAFELPFVVLPLIVALAAPALFWRTARRALLTTIVSRKRDILSLASPVIAMELFAILTGINLGYPGRMEFASFPFVFLIAGLLLEGLQEAAKLSPRALILVVAMAAEVLFSWGLSARSTLADVIRSVQERPDVEGQGGITPGFYRATGLAVDHLRGILGLKSIAFMTADVGGVGLCCSQIRVVDLGMLTNARLAKSGYAAMPTILAQERPDVIEIHSPWAKRSRLYDLAGFSQGYQAAVLDDTRLYVRNDLVQQLLAGGLARVCSPQGSMCSGQDLSRHRYTNNTDTTDDQIFLRSGKILLVGR